MYVSKWYKNELVSGAVKSKKRVALEAENAIVSAHIKFVIVLLIFFNICSFVVWSWYWELLSILFD